MLAVMLLSMPVTSVRAGTNSAVAEKWQSAKEGGSNAWENVKHGSSNAWQSVKAGTTQSLERVKETFQPGKNKTNYVYSKKDEFVSKAKVQLEEIDDMIKQLSDKTTNATTSVKAEMQQKMQVLKGEQADLGVKYDEAKAATSEKWDQAQVKFQKAYDETKESVKEAWDWLKSKTD